LSVIQIRIDDRWINVKNRRRFLLDLDNFWSDSRLINAVNVIVLLQKMFSKMRIVTERDKADMALGNVRMHLTVTAESGLMTVGSIANVALEGVVGAVGEEVFVEKGSGAALFPAEILKYKSLMKF
jgi:hypothetical protein